MYTDFNDLHCAEGLEAVKACLEQAAPADDDSEELNPFGVSWNDLRRTMSAGTISTKKIEKEDYLFANPDGSGILSTVDFGQIFGGTGTGKTLFAMGLAVAVAGGADFLHWKCVKPRKVIYFDGELAEVTITERLLLALDGLSQSERALARDNLIIFNRDAAFNELGVELRAIDTLLGKQQMEFLVKQHGADLAVFDSRFSLLDAEMKEEGSVAKRLTISMRNRRCCNIWLHHSGKDAKRGGYGDKTAEFLMDFNIELTAINNYGQLGLKWHKARKRNDLNRDLYSDMTIAHRDNRWHRHGDAPTKSRSSDRTDQNKERVRAGMVALNTRRQTATGNYGAHDITRDELRQWFVDNGYVELDGGKFPKGEREAINKAIKSLVDSGWLEGNSETIRMVMENT